MQVCRDTLGASSTFMVAFTALKQDRGTHPNIRRNRFLFGVALFELLCHHWRLLLHALGNLVHTSFHSSGIFSYCLLYSCVSKDVSDHASTKTQSSHAGVPFLSSMTYSPASRSKINLGPSSLYSSLSIPIII